MTLKGEIKMTYYVGNMPVGDDELMHYGTKGMRWGQRRFQNRDGSLTAAGRLRYGWGRAKRGAGRAYGQARRTAKRTYKKAGNWYQRNKKTIGKVALGAGAVGLAAAGAVGFRNRKAIARAARVLGGKAFPAGTRRAQRLSKLRYNASNFGTKANRGVRNAADTLKRKARVGSQVNSSMFTGRVKDTASRYGAKVRRTADNISRTKFGQKARSAGMKAKGAANKSADYIRRTPSKISAKRMNASRLNKQKNLYRSTGIRGDLLTDKTISRMNKVDAVKRKARDTAKTIGASARTKATNARNRAKTIGASARTKVSNKVPQRVKDVATNVRVRANDARFRRAQRATTRNMNRQTLNKAKEILGTKSTRRAKKMMRTANSLAMKGRAKLQGKDFQRVGVIRGTIDRARMNPRRAARRAGVALGAAGAVGGAGYGGYRYYKRRKKSRR